MSLTATPHIVSSHGPASLAGRLASGDARAVVAFAGQGVDVLDELAALVAQRPELAAGVALGTSVLSRVAASDLARSSGAYRHGVDVGAWVMDPDGAPEVSYLRGAAVSYPLSLLAQALLWRSLWADALRDAVGAGSIIGLAGHSQGLLAAQLVAEDPSVPDAVLERHLERAAIQGLHMAAAATGRSPMAAIEGVTLERLEPILASVNAERAASAAAASRPAAASSPGAASPAAPAVTIALVNTPTRVVVAGAPADLDRLHARLSEVAAGEEAARREGRRGGAPLRFAWVPLGVDVPFHSPALAAPLDRFSAWLGDAATPSWAPVLGVVGDPVRSQFVEPVRWDAVAASMTELDPDWVLDLGPGTAVARMTAENLRGSGIRTLALASPEGRRVLTSPGAAPADRDVTYASLAPRAVELPGGRVHLDTRYTRATGRPPVILAGMTPTTVDAPIVAAAANAGYMAELAGGGQPDRRTFDLRVEELSELLEPGREVVFNTLLLDRHLWELHISRDALLFGARRAGAPFAGLTVSAGLPDVEEAIALLDRLAAEGMRVNAFKPGTAEQIRQLLAIADAAPHHTIAAHLEGGRAGGHHSWEDLEELLLETYHELRRRPNVLVCAGGGIGTPERAADLLHGTWALAHGAPVMPVDAVLVGTAAMAVLESAASPQVKRALVAADGAAGWVPRRGVEGGVTSARSNLNADIHLLDNSASRAGHLLESVAGDEAAVLARRDEIVEALAKTAKPYIGDVEAITYLELLSRFTERCATGRFGRYDDGAWGHPSWRARALALFERFAARLDAAESGPIEFSLSLDDPAEALRAFAASWPASRTTLLHPADAQFFLEVCDRPGKPVPFVPVLDGEVRRWYMADGLWQAQDDRLDWDEVFVIPGPEAVAGITRADEPVADLLARFEAAAIARAGVPVERERLADPGPAPAPLSELAAGSGPIAALCAAQCVVSEDGRVHPNPLWRLVAPGDTIASHAGTIVLRPSSATVESVTLAADGDDATVTIDTATGDPLVLRFRAPTAAAPPHAASNGAAAPSRSAAPPHAVAEIGGDAARAAFAARALAAEAPARVDDPLLGVVTLWSCAPDLPHAYRAATGAAHDGVPVDLALTLAWPALTALLAYPALATRLSELVHASHAVTPGAAWPPLAGEAGETFARLVELEDPAGAPTRLRCHARLTSARGVVADVEAELAILGDAPATAFALRRRDLHDLTLTLTEPGDADFLAAQPWLDLHAELVAGDVLRVRAETTVDVPHAGEPAWSATGTIERAGNPVATIRGSSPDAAAPARAVSPAAASAAPAAAGASAAAGAPARAASPAAASPATARPVDNPVAAALALLATPGPDRLPRPARTLATAEDAAPISMEAFARVGGDRNPLHRSVLAARMAGLQRPIAHGAWTAARASAFVVDALCGGDATLLREWRVTFLAPVALGAILDFEASRVAVAGGRRVIQVRVSAGETDVALGEAIVDPLPAAFVFPGQGIQRQGLGAEGRARSRAARAVWARADAHTRATLGFSLLDVVERNPRELRLASGRVVRHPGGVLFRTEFTQPALVALAAAQLAELRAEGAVGEELIAAGHSVGEFSALHALGALTLEDALTLVHRRGEAMQAHVPRGADGTSPYRLAVVDPNGADITQLLESDPVEIVNHNATGRQYAVAGTADALAALEQRLGKRAVRVLPGIDVPFHSSVLQPAVDEFRAHLEAVTIDSARLVGRWVPNLVGRPFRHGDDAVELLARQLASPVRWIDAQHALTRELGARRLVEIAPPHADVLTGLARITLAGVELLHSERDRDAVLDRDVEEEVRAEVSAPVAVPTGADTSARTPATEATPDRPVDAGDALELVLALQARVRLDQLDPAETLDELFQGVSSRRNQVLIDLGREFGLSGAEGVQRQTIGELVKSLREQGAAYRFPGAYLREALAAGLSRAGLARTDGAARLASCWALGPGLTEHVLARVALDTRPGPSARGGELARLRAGAELLERAVELTAADLGITLAPVVVAEERARAPVRVAEPAVVEDLGEPLPEHDPDAERLALLDAELGETRAAEIAPRFDARRHVRFTSAWASARWDLVTAYHDALAGRLGCAELGAEIDRLAAHAPDITATATYLAAQAEERGFPDVAATLARIVAAAAPSQAVTGTAPSAAPPRPAASPAAPATTSAQHVAPWPAASLAAPATAPPAAAPRNWSALPLRGVRPAVDISPDVPRNSTAEDDSRPRDLILGLASGAPDAPVTAPAHVAPALVAALGASLKTSPDLCGEIALVTGASPGSIAAELVKRLLRGGATVVATTSTATPERRRFYRDLYRTSAGPDAQLHVVPANLASFNDIDALVEWLLMPGGGRQGRDDLRMDPLAPTLLAPFAALSTMGDASEAGPAFETALRLQLLGVQRLIGRLAPRTVLLPLSPNHGSFGGDGPYGETKAALEVMLRRARNEAWGEHTRLIAPRIGWVRGTGLMGANDAIAPLVEERLNVRTFGSDEIGWLLAALVSPEVREHAPFALDASGRLPADLRGALEPLARELRDRATRNARRHQLEENHRSHTTSLEALPSPGTDTAPAPAPAAQDAPADHGLAPQDLVVIVGAGELGPGGTGRSRFALELDELASPGVVAELAWLTGLVTYETEHYRGRWIDAASGEEVPEARLAERYADAVAERVGVRALESDGTIDAAGHTVLAPVTLERDLTFEVATEEEARAFAGAEVRSVGDRFKVTQKAGTQIRVPRVVAHTRRVAGQLPTGLDLARFGVPSDLIATADRMALVNLACTVEAFADAGLTPEELLAHVHPSQVANTQGAGMGGMASLRRLLLDHLLAEPRQNDRVQESLGNVVAAHAVQTYVGSYGPMIHPVGACATAAVSLEVAYDKIASGGALAVLAGGFDDLTPEGMVGFADMGATASSEALEAMGLAPHEASRANDVRRAGFVEAQGGGAQLVVRGDVALALGLPVRGVLVFAGSFADGLHTSIPAAGMGALGAATPLKAALDRHGLTADDLGVVSKHDTSTEMNDPAEAELHERIQRALGRTPGNPLPVVSQKTVTGHAKGGAAAWQLDGVLRMLETGVVPGNRNLESVDPLEREHAHLTLGDRPIRLAEPLRAALITSLGFGHVSAVLAVAHPDSFLAAVPADGREEYLRRAGRRRAEGAQRRLAARVGRTPEVRRNGGPRPARDTEAATLLAQGMP